MFVCGPQVAQWYQTEVPQNLIQVAAVTTMMMMASIAILDPSLPKMWQLPPRRKLS
jgi:hypothetical protein